MDEKGTSSFLKIEGIVFYLQYIDIEIKIIRNWLDYHRSMGMNAFFIYKKLGNLQYIVTNIIIHSTIDRQLIVGLFILLYCTVVVYLVFTRLL